MELRSSAPPVLRIRIKSHRREEPEQRASSSSTRNRRIEKIHGKSNRGDGKTTFLGFRQAKHADVMAACILMGIRRSKSETDLDGAKLCKLRWICAKIERQRKKTKEVVTSQSDNCQGIICGMLAPSMMASEGQSIGQCLASNSIEEVNAGAAVEKVAPSLSAAVGAAEVEMHPCDKCDKVFNSGQALGGHKRAHYKGPPICRPGSNGRFPAAEVVRRDFDLNESAEEVVL